MNKNVLGVTLVLLAITILANSMFGTVAATRGENKKDFKSYILEGILIHPIITNQEINFPMLIMDGTRAPDGVVECTITIDGIEYSYPEDFGYTEAWHLELNVVTGMGVLTDESIYTFNLPGKPSIAEWIITERAAGEYSGIFQLSGARMFNKVEGGGTETGLPGSYNGEDALFVNHMGLIKGWPFGE